MYSPFIKQDFNLKNTQNSIDNMLKYFSGAGAEYALQDSIINNLIYGEHGVHPNISGKLKESDLLKGYHEGDSGFYLHHNIADELINSIIENIFFNRYKEPTPTFEVGKRFGKKGRGRVGISGGQGGFNLNIGGSF